MKSRAPLKARGMSSIRAVDVAAVKKKQGFAVESRMNCELLLVSGGWSPVVHLLSHRGVKPAWDAEQACFVAPPTDEPTTRATDAVRRRGS